MASTAITTLVKMVETLPGDAQSRVVEHLRDYIAEIDDEIRWDNLFANTQHQLEDAAIRAKKEIAEGYAKPMDFDQL